MIPMDQGGGGYTCHRSRFLGIGRFTFEEQCIAERRRERFARLVSADSDVAVRAARVRVALPVGQPHAFERAFDFAVRPAAERRTQPLQSLADELFFRHTAEAL